MSTFCYFRSKNKSVGKVIFVCLPLFLEFIIHDDTYSITTAWMQYVLVNCGVYLQWWYKVRQKSTNGHPRTSSTPNQGCCNPMCPTSDRILQNNIM